MAQKKVELRNKGMSQDMSISKEIQEFAFENHNIRIQATDDNTLLAITNIKGPKIVSRQIFNSDRKGAASAIFKDFKFKK